MLDVERAGSFLVRPNGPNDEPEVVPAVKNEARADLICGVIHGSNVEEASPSGGLCQHVPSLKP